MPFVPALTNGAFWYMGKKQKERFLGSAKNNRCHRAKFDKNSYLVITTFLL